MTTTESVKTSVSFVSETATNLARIGRLLRDVLFFSLADDRIAPKRYLLVMLEGGSVSVVSCFRVFSRVMTRQIRRYPLETGTYPSPENLASAVALAIDDLGAAGTQITLLIPKVWAIVKTTEFPIVVKDTLSDVIAYELDRLTPLS